MQLQPSAASLQFVKPRSRSAPDRAGAVLQQRVDPLQSLFGIGAVDDESLRVACRGIKPAQASCGCPPQNTVAALKQVVNGAVRQALFHAVAGELVAIEPRQAITGRKPHESPGVLDDTVYLILRKAISGGVGFDGQTFRQK